MIEYYLLLCAILLLVSIVAVYLLLGLFENRLDNKIEELKKKASIEREKDE